MYLIFYIQDVIFLILILFENDLFHCHYVHLVKVCKYFTRLYRIVDQQLNTRIIKEYQLGSAFGLKSMFQLSLLNCYALLFLSVACAYACLTFKNGYMFLILEMFF